jgi:predicted DCC family thiol-disulfide oxidoreductase YuxK
MKRTLSDGRGSGGPATMLYDSDCGLCTKAAGCLGERAPAARLTILPLASAAADPWLAPLVAGRDLASTLHLVTADGEVVTGAGAVLAAARTVPRWGAIARIADHRVGRALLEPAYRLIAANRHRIGRRLGIEAACEVPPDRAAEG